MPAISPLNPLSLDPLAVRAIANNTTQPGPLHVICAFPVSGQYGPGSRILYYVLVAACVLARKTAWLRNACLAAALILPAIAAIHGIVLAALHRDNAVDLDIYGALQLCAIAMLTAPAMVRLSKTYFNNPGRNVLFVWTMLVLAGLMSLCVEFFRSHTSPCTDDGSGKPLYPGTRFPYGETTCGLVCSADEGPFSPMRDGPANDIYVVPAPRAFKFGAATLIAAACCIPGILSMVSTWEKIMRTNWAKQFGNPETDEVIEGTNGATIKGMRSVNDVIRRLLSVVEIPVFGGAVLALIIMGEYNFWSPQMKFKTESIANVSQWSNILASVLAACGSLYMLLAEYLETAAMEAAYPAGPCHCTCHGHGCSSRPGSLGETFETAEIPRTPEPIRTSDSDVNASRREHNLPPHHLTPIRTDTYPDDAASIGLGIRTIDSASSATANGGGMAGTLMKIANALGTVSADRFDDYSSFRQGKATLFPEIPGEGNRNSRLHQIKQQWGGELHPEHEDNQALRKPRSRANSFHGSISRSNSIGPRAPSPQPPPRSSTAGAPPASLLGLPTTYSPESTSDSVFPPTPTRPSAELEKTRSQGTVVTLHEGLNSPAIVLSSEDEPADSTSEAEETPRPERPPRERPPPMALQPVGTTPQDLKPGIIGPKDSAAKETPHNGSCPEGSSSKDFPSNNLTTA